MLKGSPYRMAQFVLFYFCSLGGEHGVFQKRFMSQLILQIQKVGLNPRLSMRPPAT